MWCCTQTTERTGSNLHVLVGKGGRVMGGEREQVGEKGVR